MKLRYACGHSAVYEAAPVRPECPTCQERRVSRVWAPPPRFRGLCTGPSATHDPTVSPHNTPLTKESA